MGYSYKKGLGIVDGEGNQILQLLAVNCTKEFLAASGKCLARLINEEDVDVGGLKKRIKELLEDNDRLVKQYEELTAPLSDTTPCALCPDLKQARSYFQAVDDALVLWGMTATGEAKVDLTNLIGMEQTACLDPAISPDARALIKLGRCSSEATDKRLPVSKRGAAGKTRSNAGGKQ